MWGENVRGTTVARVSMCLQACVPEEAQETNGDSLLDSLTEYGNQVRLSDGSVEGQLAEFSTRRTVMHKSVAAGLDGDVDGTVVHWGAMV